MVLITKDDCLSGCDRPGFTLKSCMDIALCANKACPPLLTLVPLFVFFFGEAASESVIFFSPRPCNVCAYVD